MTPAFFRRARRPEGAILVVGSQPVTVRVLPEVFDSDGNPVTATHDGTAGKIEIKAEPLAAMRDSLVHELFHATVHGLRLSDRFRGRSRETRLKAEEDIAHLALPVLLGAMDQCSPKRGRP